MDVRQHALLYHRRDRSSCCRDRSPESEGRLAATYDAATIGIAEADERRPLLRVNDTLCAMLGRSREELLEMTFFDYTQEDDRTRTLNNTRARSRAKSTITSIRKRARTGRGAIIYLDVYSSSVRMRTDASATAYAYSRMSPPPSTWKTRCARMNSICATCWRRYRPQFIRPTRGPHHLLQ